MPNRFSALSGDPLKPDPSSLSAAAEADDNTTNGKSTELQNAVPNADSYIDQSAALAYWSSISADDAGVLGGYPQVSRADLQGSTNFLAKLRRSLAATTRQRQQQPEEKDDWRTSPKIPLPRAVDCGAGIGRVTLGFLSRAAAQVDVVEPVAALTDVITRGASFAGLRAAGRIGRVYNAGLEAWAPERAYALVWNQWCLGQLTDAQLVAYLRRVSGSLERGGWIVVKENLSTDREGRDIFDGTDNSVTRTDERFRELFRQAGLRVVATELQKGMPKSIYPIRSYALQPEAHGG